MIIHLFWARVRPGRQSEFQQKIEAFAMPLVKSQPGMLACYLEKPIDLPRNEFVLVTIWQDLVAFKAFAGDNWTGAIGLGEELPLLEDTFVHHYEVPSPPLSPS
jgi:heme-degrading monooxygenase HmoA